MSTPSPVPLFWGVKKKKKKIKVLSKRRHTPTKWNFEGQQLVSREKMLVCLLVRTTAWVKNMHLKKGTGNALGNILQSSVTKPNLRGQTQKGCSLNPQDKNH